MGIFKRLFGGGGGREQGKAFEVDPAGADEASLAPLFAFREGKVLRINF